MPMILGRAAPARQPVLDMGTTLRWRATGWLEVSQVLTWIVPEPELVMDTFVTWNVSLSAMPGVNTRVHTLSMTSGGLDVTSFDYSASRTGGATLDATLSGARDTGDLLPITVAVEGGQSAVFACRGTLAEREAGRTATERTTTLHARDAILAAETELGELVPWERDRSRRTLEQRRRIQQMVSLVPPAQRAQARGDSRRMPVDAVVLAALATVPHRRLVAAPFSGYDFLATGGPSYSTAGKTARQVVQEIWGQLGITATWNAGVLVIRPPGPAGDLILPVPAESVRYEYITLDAPAIQAEGGTPAEDPEGQLNSPDPAERELGGEPENLSFTRDTSPAPEVDSERLAADAVPLSWEIVKGASQYILERLDEEPTPYSSWSRITTLTVNSYVDTTVIGMQTYWYRLRVNATAIAGSDQSTIWAPSEAVKVVTPLGDYGPPSQPTDVDGYYRDTSSFGVSWKAPKSDRLDEEPPRKGAATGYKLKLFAVDAGGEGGEGTRGAELRSVDTTQTFYLFEGLTVGGKYELELSAYNHAGESAGDKIVQRVTLANLPPLPLDQFTVEISPDAPDYTRNVEFKIKHNPDSGATSYRVEFRKDPGETGGGQPWALLTEVPAPKEPIKPVKGEREANEIIVTATLPEHDTKYQLRVKAINTAGAAAPSDIGTVTTDPEEPQREPDPETADFESGRDGARVSWSMGKDSATRSTIWKQGGRVVQIEVAKWAMIPKKGVMQPKKLDDFILLPTERTRTRNMYDLPNWPATLTGSLTEIERFDPTATEASGMPSVTILDARSLPSSGFVMALDRIKVARTWNPQGWLESVDTTITKSGYPVVQTDAKGKILRRETIQEREYRLESWCPTGDGEWTHIIDHTGQTLAPEYRIRPDGKGDWNGQTVIATRVIEGVIEQTETAPEQAKLPRKMREALKKSGERTPPIPDLGKSASQDKLDSFDLTSPARWFTDPPDVKPGEPPAPPMLDGEPADVKNGSEDTSGRPAPEGVPDLPEEDPVTEEFVQPGTTPGQTQEMKLPWVRTRAGLRKFAEVAAQVRGPRYRITRTYALPCPLPSLDQVESIQASGEYGQFTLTVVTESRTKPTDI